MFEAALTSFYGTAALIGVVLVMLATGYWLDNRELRKLHEAGKAEYNRLLEEYLKMLDRPRKCYRCSQELRNFCDSCTEEMSS